ncbi:MAG: hypothetical protein M9915_02430 [Rhizobacter sp.]|nr:hypothetical protein [Rhizobacter sp.]
MIISVSLACGAAQAVDATGGAGATGAAAPATNVNANANAIANAVTDGWLGLYDAKAFSLSIAGAGASPPSRQAAWYFRGETVAVPKSGLPLAGYEPGVRAFDDVEHWASTRAPDAALDYPPLVWVAAPQRIRDARLAPDGKELITSSGAMPFKFVPKIALNRSYADASSIKFFASRPLMLRGTLTPEGFVARSVWPEDFAFGPDAPATRALPAGDATQAMRTLMREMPQGGAQSPYAAMTLWQRPGDTGKWVGKPVLGLMVNGAQGDDDEAHGGHFAIVTGRVQADGNIGDWLVNNFYSLDVESEKGIIAAPVPLDNYLADLNAGQGWYRPSTMLVAVLDDERAAVLVQSALNRVYNQFYRHQLVYYHPNQNCASISVDTLRALGWDVPARGPSSRVLAWLGYPFIALKDMSIGKAKLAFDYLRTDQTRLMPAAALEEAFASLLALASGAPPQPPEGKLAAMLAKDVVGLAFLRFPQFPSSRAFGDAPAVSTWEYRTLVPNDPALMQIVPVPPRPFPEDLRDPDLLPPRWTPADYATIVWAVLTVVGLPWLIWRWWRRRARRRDPGYDLGQGKT